MDDTVSSSQNNITGPTEENKGSISQNEIIATAKEPTSGDEAQPENEAAFGLVTDLNNQNSPRDAADETIQTEIDKNEQEDKAEALNSSEKDDAVEMDETVKTADDTIQEQSTIREEDEAKFNHDMTEPQNDTAEVVRETNEEVKTDNDENQDVTVQNEDIIVNNRDNASIHSNSTAGDHEHSAHVQEDSTRQDNSLVENDSEVFHAEKTKLNKTMDNEGANETEARCAESPTPLAGQLTQRSDEIDNGDEEVTAEVSFKEGTDGNQTARSQHDEKYETNAEEDADHIDTNRGGSAKEDNEADGPETVDIVDNQHPHSSDAEREQDGETKQEDESEQNEPQQVHEAKEENQGQESQNDQEHEEEPQYEPRDHSNIKDDEEEPQYEPRDHSNIKDDDEEPQYEPRDHSNIKDDEEEPAAETEVEDVPPPGPSMEEIREQEEFSRKLESTEDASLAVTERLDAISEMLNVEREHLLQTPLKDYERLERLSSVIHSSKVVCKHYETTMLHMSEKMNQVNQVINAINKTVEKKITNEGLLSWAEQLKTNPSDPESVAREAEILAKGAEAREAVGKASCEIAKVEERAADLAAETVEAALTATKAQQTAEEARVAAEISKKAAEQRRLEQEEAKRKAEDIKRQRDEMERLKREEEERQRLEKELLTDGTPEERERIRREVERRNPKNWPVWVYSVEPGNAGIPVGCVIRCLPDVTSRDQFTVEKLDQLSGILPLEPQEELVSNIIRISHSDPNFKSMEPLCIAVPHCAPRINSRECVLKMMQASGNWVELGTSDAIFEDMREYKFSECKVQRVAILAVVTRIKKEQHTVHKRGGKVVPSVDTRICFTVRQSMFKVSTTVTVEVFPIDSTLVADLRYRKPHCEGLLASSPMIRFHTPLKKFSKPVMVNIPLPQNPANQKRPSTAAANKSRSGSNDTQAKARPTSAFMATYAKHEEEEEDQVHLLTKDNEGEWIVVEGVNLVQPKNKDIITFEMEQPFRKFLLLRCKPDVSFTGFERIATMMEEIYTERVVQVVLRQKDDDASSVRVHCGLISRMESIVRKLGEQGYNYGPLPSQDIILHEGQPMKISFRGNVINENGHQMNLIFNSHIKTTESFQVVVKDTFAQKSIDCYRGFCQLSLMPSEEKPEDVSTSVYLQRLRLTELLINLPKPEPEAPKAIVERAPVQVKSDGLVNKDLLQQVAGDLGEEWKRLAQQLNIKRMRVQAIIRNNVERDTEHAIYEMLLTWMKRVPKSANKVDMLCNALLAIGRVDIAEILKDKELDYKKEKAISNRDSYLRKAFVQIAQSPHIVSDWKFLGRQLEVRELDLEEVDEAYTSMREKCFHSLIRWREIAGEDATPALLLETLRKCKYNHVADQVYETLKCAL